MQLRTLLIFLLLCGSAYGQTTQPPLVIEPADADEFREIVNTVGAKDQPLLIRWYQRLVAKQQAAVKPPTTQQRSKQPDPWED